MKYAFPGKAGFYVTNNLPIFFHGPLYSSFNKFNEKYKIGLCCDSFDPEDISINLERFITDKTFYGQCQTNSKTAYDEEFSNQVFEERVLEYFN